MDLLTAKVEAAKESRTQKKTAYVYVEGDGECDFTLSTPDAKKEVLHAYQNGKEIPYEKKVAPAAKKAKSTQNTTKEPVVVTEEATQVPNQKVSSTKTKTNKVMATATKTTKKAAKKTAKKSAPAKTAKTAVKIEGKKKTTTVKEVLAWVKKGNRAYNKDGKPLPEGYLARMSDPAREIEVTLVEVK